MELAVRDVDVYAAEEVVSVTTQPPGGHPHARILCCDWPVSHPPEPLEKGSWCERTILVVLLIFNAAIIQGPSPPSQAGNKFVMS